MRCHEHLYNEIRFWQADFADLTDSEWFEKWSSTPHVNSEIVNKYSTVEICRCCRDEVWKATYYILRMLLNMGVLR
jgi:hypothetical protein